MAESIYFLKGEQQMRVLAWLPEPIPWTTEDEPTEIPQELLAAHVEASTALSRADRDIYEYVREHYPHRRERIGDRFSDPVIW